MAILTIYVAVIGVAKVFCWGCGMKRVTVIALAMSVALSGCVSTRTYYEPLDCSNNATTCTEGNQFVEKTGLSWRMPSSDEWMKIFQLSLDAGTTALQYSGSKSS